MTRFLVHYTLLSIVLISIFGFWSLTDAQDYLANYSPNFRLMIKLISLNEQIDFSSNDTFRVGIPSDDNFYNITSSKSDSVLYAFSEFLKDAEMHSKPIKICPVQSDSFAVPNHSQFQCILVSHKCASSLEKMLEICREYNVLSFTFDSVYVTRGVSVGIYSDQNNIPITFINWNQFQEEEWGLGAQILQFAKIYKIND
ncbi:MAG: hypothetical protein JSW33_06385 [bacterium]|nr:MAG: hypothetical protein JSW33_06385 [bacterium]